MTAQAPAGWRRLWPGSVASQLAVLLVLSVILINAVIAVWLFSAHQQRQYEHPAETTGRIIGLVELVDRTPPAERGALVRLLRERFPDIDAGLAAPGATLPPGPASSRAANVSRALSPRFTVATVGGEAVPPDRVRLAIGLPDGQTLLMVAPEDPPPPLSALTSSLVLLVGTTVVLGIWAVMMLTRPLRAIAGAVESFATAGPPTPLPETGPAEIRTLAQAINRMQQRIGALLEERTRAFAAVGHDLRTPITRLRLRAEFVEDATERERMLADLDQMEALVTNVLTHLREGQCPDDLALTDLPSVLQTVCDRFADLGQPVPLSGPVRLTVRGRAVDLGRAVTNLVDNALKYGSGPQIRLAVEARWAFIDVVDQGPGIPREGRAAMIQPFVRGDPARSMNAREGFGLGLSIARTIAEAHGGRLELLDGRPSGFVARIALPLA